VFVLKTLVMKLGAPTTDGSLLESLLIPREFKSSCKNREENAKNRKHGVSLDRIETPFLQQELSGFTQNDEGL